MKNEEEIVFGVFIVVGCASLSAWIDSSTDLAISESIQKLYFIHESIHASNQFSKHSMNQIKNQFKYYDELI